MPGLILTFLLLTSPLSYGYNLYGNQRTVIQRFPRQMPFYSLQTPGLYTPAHHHHHYDGASSNTYHAVPSQQVPVPVPYVYSHLNGPHVGQDGVLVNFQGLHNAAPSVVPTSTLPMYYTDCPCNQYTMIEETRQIVCICPQLNQLPIRKCPEENVCLLRHACSEGEINIIAYVTFGIHASAEPTHCNEITHTCCLLTYPKKQKSEKEEQNQIANNISNSTIHTLSNNITRYVIQGNLVKILNNGRPFVPIIEEDENERNKKSNKTEEYDYTSADIDPRYIRTQPLKVSTSSVFVTDEKAKSVPLTAENINSNVSAIDENDVTPKPIISEKIHLNKTTDLTLLQSPELDNHNIIIFANNEENPTQPHVLSLHDIEMDAMNQNIQIKHVETGPDVSSSTTTLTPQTQSTTSKLTTSTSQFYQVPAATTLVPTTFSTPKPIVSTTVVPVSTDTASVNIILKGNELENIFGTPDNPAPSSSSTQNVIKIEATSSPSPVPTSTITPRLTGSLRNTNGKIALLRNASRTNATIGAILRSVRSKLANVKRPPAIVMPRINVEHLHELFANGNPTIVIIQDPRDLTADVARIDGNDNESRQTYVSTKGNEKVEVENIPRIVAQCVADMICVQKSYCTTDGILSNVRIDHSEEVQLPECTDDKSGITGNSRVYNTVNSIARSNRKTQRTPGIWSDGSTNYKHKEASWHRRTDAQDKKNQIGRAKCVCRTDPRDIVKRVAFVTKPALGNSVILFTWLHPKPTPSSRPPTLRACFRFVSICKNVLNNHFDSPDT
ncbi:hypothetical protein CBL_04678 [Carabus blaptoides fortunei]